MFNKYKKCSNMNFAATLYLFKYLLGFDLTLNAQGQQKHIRTINYQYIFLGIFPLIQAFLWSRVICALCLIL